jgi:hypothetical protein
VNFFSRLAKALAAKALSLTTKKGFTGFISKNHQKQ